MSRQLQIVIFVVLLIIGGAIWGWQYWPTAGNGAGSAGFLQDYKTLNFPESRLHKEVTDFRHKAEYKGTGINPFSNEGPKQNMVLISYENGDEAPQSPA